MNTKDKDFDFPTVHIDNLKLNINYDKIIEKKRCYVIDNILSDELLNRLLKIDHSLFKDKSIFPVLKTFITLSTAQDKFYDKKIAVLYFENRGNSEEVYYTDGLSEELMNRLTKIENLSVAPSFEVKRYKNNEIDLKQIYEDLSSDFVLYGNSVMSNTAKAE